MHDRLFVFCTFCVLMMGRIANDRKTDSLRLLYPRYAPIITLIFKYNQGTKFRRVLNGRNN